MLVIHLIHCVGIILVERTGKIPLNSSTSFLQPAAMQQVMPMNDLYGRSNLDGSANYFGYSYAM
jgi:hypothetical protein